LTTPWQNYKIKAKIQALALGFAVEKGAKLKESEKYDR